VSLYGVVVIIRGWVRVGCARLSGVHEGSSSWAGPRELVTPRGRSSLCSDYIILQRFTNDYKYDKVFTVNYGAVEVDVGKLKELRINAGLSQRELATRSGLTPGAVWQVEHRGSGSPATLKKIADVLRVRPVDLLAEGR
jgi:DNA-binding XRE family transcriptional regulator